MRRLMLVMVAIVMLILTAATSEAQQIPQPSGPVLFCGTQMGQPADSYTVSVDGAAPVPLTMDATIDAQCPTNQGFTHSFTLAPSLFPLGNHIVVVYATNAFGTTAGDEFQVTVGIAPGKFTIGYVGIKQGD